MLKQSSVVPLLKDTLAKGQLSNEDSIIWRRVSLLEGDYCTFVHEYAKNTVTGKQVLTLYDFIT